MRTYRAIIVEDEPPAARRLEQMLTQFHPSIEVVAMADSVATAIEIFSTDIAYDLVLMDVQLGDGLSFEIWDTVEISKPVIFTTAYDSYTLKAFKVNSVDYLLKPIDQDELDKSLEKFINYDDATATVSKSFFEQLLDPEKDKRYRKRFLIKKGKQLEVLSISQVAYLYSEDGYTHAMTISGKSNLLDATLDALQQQLDPADFHRINRKMIISLSSIDSIEPYFNSRLRLKLSPKSNVDMTVSRDRVKGFKHWLDQ